MRMNIFVRSIWVKIEFRVRGLALAFVGLLLLAFGCGRLWGDTEASIDFRDASVTGATGPLQVTHVGNTILLVNQDHALQTVRLSVAPLTVDDLSHRFLLETKAPRAAVLSVIAQDATNTSYKFGLHAVRRDPRGFSAWESVRLDRPPEAVHPGEGFYQGPGVRAPLQVTAIEVKLQPGMQAGFLSLQQTVPTSAYTPLWQVRSLAGPEDWTWGESAKDSTKEYLDFGEQFPPRLSNAALVPKAGNYRVSLTVRDDWEGKVVATWTGLVALDSQQWDSPDVPSIPIPGIGSGMRVVEAKAWDVSTGLLARQGAFSVYSEDAPPAPPSENLAPVDILSWATPSGSPVFAPEERPTILFSVSPPQTDLGPLTLHLRLKAYTGVILRDVTLPVSTEQPIVFSDFPPGTSCWFVDAQLCAGDRVLDAVEPLLGRRNDAPPVAMATDIPPYPNGIMGGAFLIPSCGLGENLPNQLARIERGLRAIKSAGNRVVEFQCPWRDLEPLPGVYEFDYLDRCVSLAERTGLLVNFSIWYTGDHLPRWARADAEKNAEGLCQAFLFPCLSLNSPVLRRDFPAMLQALVGHYRGDRAVGGYMVTNPSLDWTYLDSWPWPHVGYTDSARAAFRDYLRTEKGLDLAALSLRYGRAISSWDDVTLPVAQYGPPYDLRPEWRDMIDFRIWMVQGWLRQNFGALRALDTVRPIWQYQYHGVGPHDAYYPIYLQYNARPTTGAVEEEHYQRFPSLASLWGLRGRGEPNPSQGTSPQAVDGGMFSLLSGGGRSCSYSSQWMYDFPDIWPEYDQLSQAEKTRLGAWLPRVRALDTSAELLRWSEPLRELAESSLPPNMLGVFYAYDSSLYGERSFTPNQSRGSELSAYLTRSEHLVPQWLADNTPLKLYQHLPIVWVDSVFGCIGREATGRLHDYAQNGGILCVSAPAGRWTTEAGRQTGEFLAALGFSAVSWSDSPPSAEPVMLGAATVALTHGCSLGDAAGTEVLARFADGSPAVVQKALGQGQVLLFLGAVDWSKTSRLLDYLTTLRPIDRWASADSPKIYVVPLEVGTTRYVYAVHYEDQPALYKPQTGHPPVSGHVSVLELPAGSYKVTDALSKTDLGTFSADQLQAGLPVTLDYGRGTLFRVEPTR